jgi:hypothetical protein
MAYDATDFVVTETPAPVVRDPKTITDPRERVAYLRDFLRSEAGDMFDMRTPGTLRIEDGKWCGTAGCFHGWTRALFGSGQEDDDWSAEMLGIPNASRIKGLFYPMENLPDGSRAIALRDPQRAANVLDHYLSTGQIDWSVA